MKYIIVFLIVAFFVLVGPIALIWSLNTLFNLGIAYTAETWLAAFIINSVVAARVSSK